MSFWDSRRKPCRACRAMAAAAVVAAAAALAAPPAAADMPKNMLFFMPGKTCPDGSSRAVNANGRMLLAVTDSGAVGRTYETPLRDQEDRTHQHKGRMSVSLPSHHIAAASSCCNKQATTAGSHGADMTTDAGPSGLPFAQLLVCQVD